MVNGFPSPRISVERGCWQVDPIAGYLFILCLEMLLRKLKSSKDLEPWTSSNATQHLIDAYAEDVNIFINTNNAPQQIKTIVKIMEEFKNFSGLSINVSTTKYALLG